MSYVIRIRTTAWLKNDETEDIMLFVFITKINCFDYSNERQKVYKGSFIL